MKKTSPGFTPLEIWCIVSAHDYQQRFGRRALVQEGAKNDQIISVEKNEFQKSCIFSGFGWALSVPLAVSGFLSSI